jgi:hypothetical protein
MMKTSLPSKTGKLKKDPNPKEATTPQGPAELGTDPETTQIVTGNSALTARSRITGKKNAANDSMKTNCAETNKDVPIGLKCM